MVSSKRTHAPEDLALRRRRAVWLAIGELWKEHDRAIAGIPKRKRKFYERGTHMKAERLMDWLANGGRSMLPKDLRQKIEECKGRL